VTAIEKAGYEPGEDCCIAIDSAASSFYSKGKYLLSAEKNPAGRPRKWSNSTRVSSRNTPSSPSKTVWPKTTGTAGSFSRRLWAEKVQIVGDDLFVTDRKRLERGIKLGVGNSILIKLNQIGTLTETWRRSSAPGRRATQR